MAQAVAVARGTWATGIKTYAAIDGDLLAAITAEAARQGIPSVVAYARRTGAGAGGGRDGRALHVPRVQYRQRGDPGRRLSRGTGGAAHRVRGRRPGRSGGGFGVRAHEAKRHGAGRDHPGRGPGRTETHGGDRHRQCAPASRGCRGSARADGPATRTPHRPAPPRRACRVRDSRRGRTYPAGVGSGRHGRDRDRRHDPARLRLPGSLRRNRAPARRRWHADAGRAQGGQLPRGGRTGTGRLDRHDRTRQARQHRLPSGGPAGGAGEPAFGGAHASSAVRSTIGADFVLGAPPGPPGR